MRLPPLSVILAWPDSDYNNPSTRGQALLVIGIVMLALVVTAVAGRLYSRIVLKRWFGVDDAMIVLACIFAIGMNIIVMLANTHFGWDRHIWDVPSTLYVEAGIIAFIAKLAFTLAATCTRLSLLCFYYRLVKDSGVQWFQWTLHASTALNLGIAITFVAQTIWLCRPIRAYWSFPPLPDARCLDEGKVMLGGGIINSFADLLTTVLPVPIIMTLRMPLHQRVGVCILLCLGFLVTLAGVLRTYFIWKSLIASYDETWYSYPLWICAMVEIDVAVICACAPAWKTLLGQTLRQASSSLSSMLSSRKRSPTSSAATRDLASLCADTHQQSNACLPRPRLHSGVFRREQRHHNAYTMREQRASHLERYPSCAELPVEGHEEEVHGDLGARSFHHSDIVLESAGTLPVEEQVGRRPQRPTLVITKRQTIEQRSSYIDLPRIPRLYLDDFPGPWSEHCDTRGF